MEQIDLVPALAPFAKPAPYKIAYGGRGAGKTETLAALLVLFGTKKALRIACLRQFQNSIRQSSYSTICDWIDKLNLHNFYDVQSNAIVGRKGTSAEGTEFFFMGLHHNIHSIKSVAKIDIAWVEEARDVTNKSWDVLIPTIRGDAPFGPFSLGSETWISFNPELEEDPTFQRFVANPPTGAVVVKLNWSDNPWFPEKLNRDRLDDLRRDPIGYRTVWEGECRQTLSGAIFANELRLAKEEGRITSVEYDKSKPVYTYWDLGRHDYTCIWFVQVIGMRYNLIDFYYEHQETMHHFIDIMRKRPYNYGICYLPHDGTRKSVASDRSAESVLRNAGFTVRMVERVARKGDSIQAARLLFDQCYFDRNKCADGLSHLGKYRYEVDPDTKQFTKEPKHDEIFSDTADAFQQIGLKARPEQPKKKVREMFEPPGYMASQQAWMA